MKNNFFLKLLILFFLFASTNNLWSETLNIKAQNIVADKNKKVIIFKGNVIAIDSKNNLVKTDYAEYDKEKDSLTTKDNVQIKTSEGYIVKTSSVRFDNLNGIIVSNENALIEDVDGNKIKVPMFEYNRGKNLFFSKGEIEINDAIGNTYKFSEIFIDEKKKKIAGSDLRAFFNPEEIGANSNNDPRIFGNTVTIENRNTEIGKGIFTYCKLKNNKKCPAWSIQADRLNHDTEKKTIFYKNAILKIYDVPIFYFPKFFHPDPTIKRQSGFLTPSFVDSKNLGAGLVLPYFVNLADDRDFTFTPKLYTKENPLFLSEYRRDFKNSYLVLDTGFTKGYQKTTDTKRGGSKNHIFLNYNLDLESENENLSNFEFKVQRVSNDTYLKVYDVETSLANKDLDVLETTLSFSRENDESSLGFTAGMYENITVDGNARYEYIFPNFNYNKSLLSNDDFGSLDLDTTLLVKNYDVDKQKELLVNDFNFNSLKWMNNFGVVNQIISKIKLTNYNATNTKNFKNDEFNTELHGVLGLMSELPLVKAENKFKSQFLTPKLLLRYSPGDMRKFSETSKRLNPSNIFTLDRINEIDTIERGFSAAVGVDYELIRENPDNGDKERKLLFSLGQIINEKEDKLKPAPLNQRFSDLAGEIIWSPTESFKMNYNYNLDQNYSDLNYSEIGTTLNFGPVKFNLDYLEEKQHMGSQEYVKTGFEYNFNNSSSLKFSTKRNLLKDSSEFYDLSYQYSIDCFKAGVVFRREFYTDRDIEADNSLLFQISIIPFTDISSPKLR